MPGLALVLVGVVLALDVRQCAERLASSGRSVPRWVKWPLNDDASGYRVLGAVLALVGLVFVVAGLA